MVSPTGLVLYWKRSMHTEHVFCLANYHFISLLLSFIYCSTCALRLQYRSWMFTGKYRRQRQYDAKLLPCRDTEISLSSFLTLFSHFIRWVGFQHRSSPYKNCYSSWQWRELERIRWTTETIQQVAWQEGRSARW